MIAVVDGLWIFGILEEVRGCMLASWSARFGRNLGAPGGTGWKTYVRELVWIVHIRKSGEVLQAGHKTRVG